MGMAYGSSKETYETLKALTKTNQHRSAVIEELSGSLHKALLFWTGVQNIVMNCTTMSSSVLREEEEEVVRTLKQGKSPGVDNVPSEPLVYGDAATPKALINLCQKIWETNVWSLVIPLPKK